MLTVCGHAMICSTAVYAYICFSSLLMYRYSMCARLYWPRSAVSGAHGVIGTGSCACRECYSKAWLWNALFKHGSPTHTPYCVPFTGKHQACPSIIENSNHHSHMYSNGLLLSCIVYTYGISYYYGRSARAYIFMCYDDIMRKGTHPYSPYI